ncbi:GbsR/MarR family transcriptional regulator [Paucisalibacillus sp. EB02]|uniref:GbsR/MarR family transcriptional regulator n=1 Tax=Paucisalibacillus sp. EB02 TaxID=1347087 RepID=UPI0005AB6CE4|nr:MarR family transcriptional regulator [Paucisalibacillus sp. EB02]
MLNNSNEKIKNGILLEFAKTVELFDLTPIEARVFAYLYVEGTPLTLDDMSDALGKSKTSMSTSVRSLVELNLVKRVWKKGVRKDLFQVNNHLFKQFLSLYMKKWTDTTEVRKDALIELKKDFDQIQSDKKDEMIQNKLHTLLEFHERLYQFFKEVSEIKKDGK